MMMSVVLLLLYMAAGVFDCVQARRKGKRYAKPFLMPLLCAFYVSGCAYRGVPVSWLLAAALLLSFLGDTLLIFSGKDVRFLLSGGIAFGLAHAAYILLFLQDVVAVAVSSPADDQALFSFSRDADESTFALFPVLPRTLLVLLVCFHVLLFVFYLVRLATRFPGRLKAPLVVYSVLLHLMCFSAMLRMGVAGFPSGVIAYAGALLFLISDTLLALNLLEEASKPRPVMQTYLLAQLLLTVAFLV